MNLVRHDSGTAFETGLRNEDNPLVHAYVTSRLDYCNSILYGLPKYQLSKLKRIQNMAARLITDTMKFDHINPVLYNLHWPPVNYRIQFKILTITFKAIHGMAPSYSVSDHRLGIHYAIVIQNI